jgi:hypothetical protein
VGRQQHPPLLQLSPLGAQLRQLLAVLALRGLERLLERLAAALALCERRAHRHQLSLSALGDRLGGREQLMGLTSGLRFGGHLRGQRLDRRPALEVGGRQLALQRRVAR